MVYDEYLKKYGIDAVFPVVDTEIGRLGSSICYDMNFPEVFRALAMKGAEVIIHNGADRFPYVKAARSTRIDVMSYPANQTPIDQWLTITMVMYSDLGKWTRKPGPCVFP